MVEYCVIRVTKPTDERRKKLAQCLGDFPDSGTFAFYRLVDAAFSAAASLDETERNRLLGLMTDRHRRIIGLIESMKANNFDALRNADAELASVPVDDIAFAMAVRLRIPWRLEAPPPQRTARGIEALRIIDDSAPFSNAAGLSYFRVLAAINGNQPLTALGTATREARSIQMSLAEQKEPEQAAVANLTRAYGTITSAPIMQTVPKWRYQETVMLMDEVLQQVGQ